MIKRTMKFNPAFLSDEELIESFVVRHADLELITEIVRNNTKQSNQHVLAIGPRGIGKTTLVLRVAAEVRRDAELSQKWYPLVFGEESYRVCSPGEFWLEAIFHLARQTKEPRWQRTYEDLHDIQDENRLRESALAQLMDFADEQSKRILLIVENLHQLLGDQLNDGDAWTLRHTLQNEPRVMLLATATTRFEEIENHGKAMFELFKPHDLKPLDTEDCRAVWQAKTGNLFTYNQIRPIQILTGGNPRLITIIAQFAKDISLQHLMRDLIQLVDDHTEYFKTHLDNLAATERKVYLALAEIWEPATAKEVAAAARLDVNKTSALLKRLIERGAVVVADDRKRTKSYYVAERMYNIYYLMRSRGGTSDWIKAIIHFMIGFFGRKKSLEILTQEACLLSPDLRPYHYDAFKMLLEETPENERKELLKSTPSHFFDKNYLPNTLKEYLESKKQTELDEKLKQLRLKSNQLFIKGDYQEAAKIERQIIDYLPKEASAWSNLGVLLVFLNRTREAEEAYCMALKFQPDDEETLFNYGVCLRNQNRLDEAEKIYNKIINKNTNHVEALNNLGEIFHLQNRFQDSEEAYRKAIELRPNDAYVHNNLGVLLKEQGRFDEAEKLFRKAIELQPNYSSASFNLGNLYQIQNRVKEAEEAYRYTIKMQPNNIKALNNLGIILYNQNRLKESENMFLKLIELQPDHAFAWYNLGNLYYRLDRLQEAEKAYNKSLEFQSNITNTWFNLGILYQNMYRLQEAEQCYRKVLFYQSDYSQAYNQLANLLLKKNQLIEAEKYSRKSLDISNDNSVFQHTLASVLIEKGELNEAYELIKKLLKDSVFIKDYTNDINDLIIMLSAKGNASKAFEILQNSPRAEKLEPLIVGLRLYMGEDERDIKTPLEVLEIGKDVKARIEERKAEMEKQNQPAGS